MVYIWERLKDSGGRSPVIESVNEQCSFLTTPASPGLFAPRIRFLLDKSVIPLGLLLPDEDNPIENLQSCKCLGLHKSCNFNINLAKIPKSEGNWVIKKAWWKFWQIPSLNIYTTQDWWHHCYTPTYSTSTRILGLSASCLHLWWTN